MGLDQGYKADVVAIPIKIPLSPLQNALENCHNGRGFLGKAFLGEAFFSMG